MILDDKPDKPDTDENVAPPTEEESVLTFMVSVNELIA